MIRIALVSLLSLLVFAGLQGQSYWEEAPGPYGGRVSISPTNSNVVYATHNTNGLYRSQDFGEHWQQIPITRVDVASNNEVLIIGYSGTFYKIVIHWDGTNGSRKLYRSSNEGATWTLINSTLPVAIFAETPTGVLVGPTGTGHIQRSINGGVTWQLVHSSNEPLGFYSTIHALPDGKIIIQDNSPISAFFVSENNGLNWAERPLPAPWATITMMPSGTLFSLPDLNSTVIYRSTNMGASWDSVAITLANQETPGSIASLNNGLLLLSTNQRLHFSDNDGVSWQHMPAFPEFPHTFATSSPLPNGHLLGTRNEALFRSFDSGHTWAFSSFGIRQASTRQLVMPTDSLLLAATLTGLWRSDDAGDNWARLIADTSNNIYYTDHPLAVLSADSFVVSLAGHLWASTDGGVTFTEVTPPSGLRFDNKNVFAAEGQNLFCTTAAGIQRSENFGASWTSVLPDQALITLESHPTEGVFAFAAPLGETSLYNLWHSSNGGQSWSEITNLDLAPTQRLELKTSTTGSVYVSGAHEHSIKLAISDDAGATWVYKIVPDIYAGFELAVNEFGQIFTNAGTDSQIYTSADGGNSWYFLPSYSDNGYLLYGLEVSPSGQLYVLPSSGTMYRTTASTHQGAFITGHVRRDADAECSTPDAQEPLRNWVVTLEGENTFFSTTGTNGRYTFFVDTGSYDLRVQPPQELWWAICDSLQTVQSDSLFSADTVDFAAIALADCPLMSVSVGVPRLRRCFDNNAYIQYCNQGSETADSARVDVILDQYLEFVSASLPHEALSNNTYRFQLGSVASGDCGQFGLVVHVNCDSTVLGQTHCITAHAFPDTLCTPVPSWSGATVVAEAECQDTVVALRLRNIGPVSSQVLPYIIIEDDVVLMSGQDEHAPGGLLTLERPANGHTWRIESRQEPGHPFSTVAVAFLEGCGGYQSLGFVNHFGVNTFEYSWDRVCVENIGAFDPNDKKGFPLGYGELHRIRPGQELDYMIRFQNTGTDTAFNIVVRDTLSPWLDPASVRPGAASHPYTWTLTGEGALQFTFANILLPDSNTNLAGSQGFIRFRVQQRPETTNGAFILNEAAIYFDFNDPIITNRTLHTVGEDYLSDASEPNGPLANRGAVNVWPNPVRDAAVFQRTDGLDFDGHRIRVTDALGRTVFEERVSGKQAVFQRRGLASGAYFFRVEDRKGRLEGSGVMMVK